LACSPVSTFGQVAQDPQLASRNMQVDLEQLISGKVRITGWVFKVSETPGDPPSLPPSWASTTPRFTASF
jgi:crotonobetainyl-CoA:carnitine CoA-transferase CaiB-like acyl-CoA transferase